MGFTNSGLGGGVDDAEAGAKARAAARAGAGAEPCGRPKKAFGMCQLALAPTEAEAVTSVDATGLSVVCPLPLSLSLCGSVCVCLWKC